jgi:hypothetical protein
MMGSMMADPGWGYLFWPMAAVVLLLAAVVAGVWLLSAAGAPHPQVGPVSAIATARAAMLGGPKASLLVTDPAAPQALRASDADRDQVAQALSVHLALSRLTVSEFEERVFAAYAAQTLGQLLTQIEDLPAAAG